MELQKIIDNLITDEENNMYFVHRTKIAEPVFNDITGEIYTNQQYCKLDEETQDDTRQFKWVSKFWNNHSLDIGANWRISEQEYSEAHERNFAEEIKNFFEKGLYSVETSIERTATLLGEKSRIQDVPNVSAREKLEQIIALEDFGFNTVNKNGLQGMFSNREALNTLLVLEIPKECFGDLESIVPLFQKSEETLTIPTAYRGVQEIDSVIPREYIKGAFHTYGENVIYRDNENYRKNTKFKEGTCNGTTVEKIFKILTKSANIKSQEIEKIIQITGQDFNTDKNVGKARERLSAIIEKLLPKVEDKEIIQKLQLSIETIYSETENPFEKAYGKISKLDFTQLDSDEIISCIENFITNGSDILNNSREVSNWDNFFNMLDIYKSGLQILNEDALKQLYSDNRANYAIALVKGKILDIKNHEELIKKIEPLDEAEIFGELKDSDREQYNMLYNQISDAKVQICEGINIDKQKSSLGDSTEDKKIANKRTFSTQSIGKATIETSISSRIKATNTEQTQMNSKSKIKE